MRLAPRASRVFCVFSASAGFDSAGLAAWMASARADCSSQSEYPPTDSRHCPSPSAAMVEVTTLSRKARSWETRNTVPL
ncbi:hypothetical protein D3C71_1931360 [compost metagenome]